MASRKLGSMSLSGPLLRGLSPYGDWGSFLLFIFKTPSVTLAMKIAACHLPQEGGLFEFPLGDLTLYFLFVGDDILGIPFIRRNVIEIPRRAKLF